MFDAFRELDYRRFWLTQFISNIGSWMQVVAQGWLVYRLTNSPLLLGIVGFSSSAPSIFLMLPGGVLADQLDRRKVLRLSQWAQTFAALALSLSIWTHHINIVQIICASLIVGSAMAFSSPAYQAMVVDLLDDRAHLSNAVAMNSLQFNLSRAIGPLLAGLALSAWGSFWCFFLNALSFLPLIWVLGRLRDRQRRSVTLEQRMMAKLAEGFRYVRGERSVQVLLCVMMASSLCGYPLVTLMPIVARKLFANDASGLGYLMGSFGAGTLTAALALAIRMPPADRMLRVIAGATAVFGLAIAAIPFAHAMPVTLAILYLAGAAMVTGFALVNTSIQQRVPDDVRGRVMSMYTYSFFAFLPFGNLLGGVMAESAGLTRTLS
jgi:MFS family permease